MADIGPLSYQVSRKSIQQFPRSDPGRTHARTHARTHGADSKIPLRNETKWNNKGHTKLIRSSMDPTHCFFQVFRNF